MSELGRAGEPELRLNVLVQIDLGRVLSGARIYFTCGLETVVCSLKAVSRLVLKSGILLSFASHIHRVEVIGGTR